MIKWSEKIELDIGNGYLDGDKEGDWTYIRAKGRSVIETY